jgi:UDP-glucuronate 4-epimerase
MKVLVTGCAGFIGSHTCEYLLNRGDIVLGIDNLNDYYDVERKKENLEVLNKYENFEFKKEDIRTTKVIEEWKPDKICHLASMAGVRYSIEHPKLYVDVNINGFINILEQARKANVKQIVYASSSSVYGLNKKRPFSESDAIETPNSPYACSKMAMELYAKTYHQLYNLNLIGLRFFTVYGPRGRPDMAPYKFLKAIKDGTKFYKYGDGTSSRDYTYVSDIVSGVVLALDNKKKLKCEAYNLGNSSPVSLNEFIELCEKVVGKKANYEQIGNQLGDVPHTYADITKAKRDLYYEPKVKLEDGLRLMYLNL